MQKQSIIKIRTSYWSNKDYLVLGIALLLLLLISYALHQNFSVDNRISPYQGQAIGKITKTEKVLKRKFSGDAMWTNVEAGYQVFNGDTLHTTQNASATLQLSKGAKIKLLEKSFLLLDFQNEQSRFQLNLLSGGALLYSQIEKQSKTVIKLGAKSLTLKKGDIRVKQSSDRDSTEQKFQISALSFETQLEIDSQVQNIQSNERLVVSEIEIKKEIPELYIQTLEPSYDKTYFSTGRKELLFTWNIDGQVDKVHLELSSSRSFSSKQRIRTFTGLEKSGNLLKTGLQPGIYFWRIRAKGANALKWSYSTTKKFSLIKKNSLDLLAPSNRRKFTTPGASKRVAFSWKSDPYATSYSLSVARDPGFNDIVHKQSLSTLSYRMNLRPGAYYWRIRSRGTLEDSGNSSPTFSFRVDKYILITKLSTSSPRADAKLSLQDIYAKDLAFKWSADTKAAYFILRAFRVKKGKNTTDLLKKLPKHIQDIANTDSLINTKTIETSHSYLKELDSGLYLWQVQSFNNANKRIGRSSILKFTVEDSRGISRITLLSPKSKKEFEKSKLTQSPLVFQWKSLGPGHTYSLTLAKDAKFQNQIFEKSNLVSARYTLPRSQQKALALLSTCYWKVESTKKYYYEPKKQKVFPSGKSSVRRFQVVKTSQALKSIFNEQKIVLKNGKVITGNITQDKGAYFEVRTRTGKLVKVMTDQISQIQN